MRIDKWLWAARFFKTRSAAQQAIEGGRVKLDGERVKPAKDVRAGQRLVMQIGQQSWEIIIDGLSEQRRSAPEARKLYTESEESRLRREEQSAMRKLTVEPAADRVGRPTKRERRVLDRFRER